jgi:hypothetical protein
MINGKKTVAVLPAYTVNHCILVDDHRTNAAADLALLFSFA